MRIEIDALAVVVRVDLDAGSKPSIGSALGRFDPAARGEEPALSYQVTTETSGRLRLGLPDGLERVDTGSGTMLHLFGHLTRAVVDRTTAVVLHAGAVAIDGRAVLLPGRMGAGKSTLTAGLVRAGAAYLTDEAAGVFVGSTEVQPFPRPIGIDRGAQHLFPELAHRHDELVAGPEAQWQVRPELLGTGLVASASPVGAIVFPRYEPGAPARLEPLSRAEALLELAHTTFHLDRRSVEALEALADVVRASTCHRLTSGSLEGSVAAVLDLAASAPAPG